MDIEKELEKLKSLVDKGLITKKDYESKKNELLGTSSNTNIPRKGFYSRLNQQDKKEFKLGFGTIIVLLLLVGSFTAYQTNSGNEIESILLPEGYSPTTSTSSSSSRKSENTYNEEKVCQDAYGNWHSYMSTCSTCGISYCVAYLPYGKYCSQRCCTAVKGMSSDCGDVWNDLN